MTTLELITTAQKHMGFACGAIRDTLHKGTAVESLMFSELCSEADALWHKIDNLSRAMIAEAKREPETTPGTSVMCKCTGPVEENTGRCRICQKPKKRVV